MHREGRLLAVLAVLVSFPAPAAPAPPRQGRPLGAFQERTINLARAGAMARLRSPECQQVLADFRDGSGRTLLENLAPYAQPPDGYLAQIPFLDGDGHELCRAGRSQLLTTQGVGRVFVCKGFLETVVGDRTAAEVYLIHEMLHTLGLGENPPSSQEITQQVKRRCAP